MKTIGEYWKDFAIRWEESSYEHRVGGLSIVERIATYQRQHILARRQTAVAHLSGRVAGLRVLEIGCGGGAFSLELLRQGAAHVTGIDISPDVIAVAMKKAREEGLADRAVFVAATIEDAVTRPFGAIDLLAGLGILEYLEPEIVVRLVRAVQPAHVVFSFDERRVTLKTALHFVYRQLKRLPYYKKYSSREIAALLADAGFPKTTVFREGDNSFITTW